jgi:hypothetical protein
MSNSVADVQLALALLSLEIYALFVWLREFG